jgi:hypothetical protein
MIYVRDQYLLYSNTELSSSLRTQMVRLLSAGLA